MLERLCRDRLVRRRREPVALANPERVGAPVGGQGWQRAGDLRDELRACATWPVRVADKPGAGRELDLPDVIAGVGERRIGVIDPGEVDPRCSPLPTWGQHIPR